MRQAAYRTRVVGAVLALVSLQVWGEEEDFLVKDKPISKWVEQLQSENRGIQLRAGRALTEAEKDLIPRIVPKLIPLLGADRENSRLPVAQILGEYGPPARVAVPHLVPMLEGTQFERNRSAASKALGQILKDAEPSEEVEKVTQALVKIFTDKYSDVRREAVTACGMIGPAAKTCVPALVPRFDDTEWLKDAECFLVRRAAAWTTGRMKEHGRCHIDKLISMMQANNPVATEFVEAIGALGPVHDNVVPNIVDKLEKTLFGGYQGASGEDMARYTRSCLRVLGSFGAKSAPAAALLNRLLTPDRVGREPGQVVEILNTLASIGSAAQVAAPAIEKHCLSAGNGEVQKAAKAALAKLKG